MRLKNIIKSLLIAVPALLGGTQAANAHDCCNSHYAHHCAPHSCYHSWSSCGHYGHWRAYCYSHSHCYGHNHCYANHCYTNHCHHNHNSCDAGCKGKCSDDSKKNENKDD